MRVSPLGRGFLLILASLIGAALAYRPYRDFPDYGEGFYNLVFEVCEQAESIDDAGIPALNCMYYDGPNITKPDDCEEVSNFVKFQGQCVNDFCGIGALPVVRGTFCERYVEMAKNAGTPCASSYDSACNDLSDNDRFMSLLQEVCGTSEKRTQALFCMGDAPNITKPGDCEEESNFLKFQGQCVNDVCGGGGIGARGTFCERYVEMATNAGAPCASSYDSACNDRDSSQSHKLGPSPNQLFAFVFAMAAFGALF